MIKEVLHEKSGAILFKADAETLRLEELSKKYRELEKEVLLLKKSISYLEYLIDC